jgi:multisubunit Na+/H+ antiporter MnhG subunit
MLHESFLRHKNYRWLKAASVLVLASLLAYGFNNERGGPNGGTWLGYGLGTLGALLILWLTWLGVRKRRYKASSTVKGWTSAHVYLGLALIFVATLHTGFQFGWNIHTLAYALMMLVIASGIYGMVVYARYPREITSARAGGNRDLWINEVLDLSDQALKLADGISPEVHRNVVASNQRVTLGGGFWAQLWGIKAPPRQEFSLLEKNLDERKTRISEKLMQTTSGKTVMFMASQLVKSKDEVVAERLQQLLDVLARRNELVVRINRDINIHARLQIWLYLHVPLTFALLAALGSHVVSVFFYW